MILHSSSETEMRRFMGVVAVGVGLLFTAVPGSGQTVDLAVGFTAPTQEFETYADGGWLLVGGVQMPLGQAGLWVDLEGFYGNNNYTDDRENEKTNPLGGMASIGYGVGQLYVFGGGGLVSLSQSEGTGRENASSFGWQAGGGLDVPLGRGATNALFVEGRYMAAEDFSMYAVLGGLRISF